eukprot:GHVU01130112.1.p1 GENE.GHVU01130112.1~~GHVU01130112.1.p1  ORF type:complete len:665 (+),score=172.23 GHVU01130112.1:337-2331(+)
MEDDEKEMLSEARARLANTRGKKAKRKAREKQLEEARRLAVMQKKRELKAAGIHVGRGMRRNRKYIDYSVEVPFEHKPPIGFHAVGDDETPKESVPFANLSLSGVEGQRRDHEEERHRKDDRRKIKRLQEEDYPAHLKMVEKLNDPQTVRKKSKLMLPEPQLTDAELETIIRLGESTTVEGFAGVVGPSNELLTAGGGGTGLSVLTPMRTPMRPNTVLIEAQNAIARANAGNPLDGAELVQQDVTPGIKPETLYSSALAPQAVPPRSAAGAGSTALSTRGHNTPASVSARGGATTPGSVMRGGGGLTASATPLRDDLSMNDNQSIAGGTDVPRGMMKQLQRQIRAALDTLPPAQNEIDVAVPELPEEEPMKDDGIEEDAEDVEKRKREVEERRRQQERAKMTSVVRRGLPRPYFLDVMKLTSTQSDRPSRGPDAAEMKNAEDLLLEEMRVLIVNDAVKYPPHKDLKPPKNAPFLEDFPMSEIEGARAVLEKECADAKAQLNHFGDLDLRENPMVARAWDDALVAFVYLPHARKYAPLKDVTKNDRLDAAKRTFESLSALLTKDSKKASKLESKLELLTGGYRQRIKAVLKSIEETWQEGFLQTHTLSAFKVLQAQERKAMYTRKNGLEEQVQREKDRHKTLQTSFRNHQLQIEKLERALSAVVD